MSNFELSRQLRLFLSVGSNHVYLGLGDRFPVSIRRKCLYTQVIKIYPCADWKFFSAGDIRDLIALADAFGLVLWVGAENGVPVIEIEDLVSNGL